MANSVKCSSSVKAFRTVVTFLDSPVMTVLSANLKEAFSKAVGLGLRMPMTWRDCEILNHPSGQPYVRLSGELKTWFEAQGWRAHVTVSDETDYATSVVVVEHLPL